jgi:hypothetical protein
MTVQYVYLADSGQYLGSNTNLGIQSVRLTFSWGPAAMAR